MDYNEELSLKDTWKSFAKEALDGFPGVDDPINIHKSAFYVGALAAYRVIADSLVEAKGKPASEATQLFISAMKLVHDELNEYKQDGIDFARKMSLTKEQVDKIDELTDGAFTQRYKNN